MTKLTLIDLAEFDIFVDDFYVYAIDKKDDDILFVADSLDEILSIVSNL